MKRYPITLLLTALLLLSGLACGAITDTVERASDAKSTAEAGIAQVQAMATQAAHFQNTYQAFATQNPALVGTAQSFLTTQGPGLLATAQSLATQNPDMIITAQALATQGLTGGSGPADIPMAPGENNLLLSTTDSISYSTRLEFRQVLEFYRTQMPAYGWNPVAQGTVETENVAVLNYVRSDRTANLTMHHNAAEGVTIVLVTVNRQ